MSEAAQQVFTVMWLLFIPVGPNNPQERTIAYFNTEKECLDNMYYLRARCTQVEMKK